MESVNPVIQAGILRVSSLTAFGIHRKVVVLLAIVKILLRIPEPVVAAEMDLRPVGGDALVRRSAKRRQVRQGESMLDPELWRQPREIMVVMIRDLASGNEGILHVPPIFDLSIFSVHDQLHTVLNRHLHGVVRLSVNEGLERISQVQKRKLGQQPGYFRTRRRQHMIKSSGDKIVQVRASDGGGE